MADDLDDLHICECKQMTAKLSNILNSNAGEAIPQMSKEWIEDVIVRMGLTSKLTTKNLGSLLDEVINKRQIDYTKSHLGVHKTEKLIYVVKLQ